MKPWIFFVAGRYFRTKRKVGGLSPQSLQVVGIAVGVMTLVAVMSVMNGLQLGFIEDILEISSYHIRITASSGENTESLIRSLHEVEGVRAVLPFVDIQTMGRGMFEDYKTLLIRGVPADAPDQDPALIRQLNIIRGDFDLYEERSIVLGYEYALEAGIHIGDSISILSMDTGIRGLATPGMTDFIVSGLFQSGYYDFDGSLGFVSLNDISCLRESDSPETLILGVKLKDRFRDVRAMRDILRDCDLPAEAVVSWRDYNRSFFGALRMEKIAMEVLIGLIFLVVAVNVFHSQRRAVYERQEEIGILKGIGAPPNAVRYIFLCDGFLIGMTGAVIGLLLGLLTAVNINAIFTFIETAGNAVMGLGSRLLFHTAGGGMEILSPSYFYLADVPVRILFPEVLGVFIFAVATSSLAAYFASSRVSRIYPQRVLRYE